MDNEILSILNKMQSSELVDIQYIIDEILYDREVDENTIIEAVRYLCSKSESDSIRYTKLTLYLEGAGFKRDAIGRRFVMMWKKALNNKNILIAEGGSPIGESDTEENPIYPRYEGERYHQICYVRCRNLLSFMWN